MFGAIYVILTSFWLGISHSDKESNKNHHVQLTQLINKTAKREMSWKHVQLKNSCELPLLLHVFVNYDALKQSENET
jgi:hypothetical protein